MIPPEAVLEQTLAIRDRILDVVNSIPEADIDRIPESWSNNVHWHVGHLVVVPCMLARMLSGQALGLSEEYKTLFAKGTAPSAWDGHTVPPIGPLKDQVRSVMMELFHEFANRLTTPFPQPYTTSAGVVLKTPGEALNFSLAHDGIHLGLLLALRRSLAVSAK